MGNLSAHFDKYEFTCPCGKCGADFPTDSKLVNKLETLYNMIGADSIIITSGYRCPEYSGSIPGGSRYDAHTKGIAADIVVNRNGTRVNSTDIAEAAERVGFSGIGIIDDTAVHVDVRNNNNYVNPHWFGNEMTGNNNIETFQRGTVFPSHVDKISKEINAILDIEGHKYSGILMEVE